MARIAAGCETVAEHAEVGLAEAAVVAAAAVAAETAKPAVVPADDLLHE